MNNQELKPCPFCGGTEIFIKPDEVGSGGQWVAPIYVGCDACKCDQVADDQDEAVAAWNRRAAPITQPVAWRYLMELSGGVYCTTRWLEMEEPIPEGARKVEYAYALPSDEDSK